MSLWRQLQRYLVFVVVTLVVGAQTDEDGQLVVLQVRGVRQQVVGVYKHLQTLVLTQIEVRVLVDGFRLTLCEVLHDETERLLVVLNKLRLAGVSSTADAWRQGVGHWLAVCILFDVHSAHLHRARLSTYGCLQALLVLTPLATH